MKILILCLGLLSFPLVGEEKDDPSMSWYSRAHSMDEEDARDLENRLKKKPEDMKNHATLMIYYSNHLYEDQSEDSPAAKSHLRHLSWVLERDPALKIFEWAHYPSPHSHKAIHELESKAWEKALKKFVGQAAAFGNAAKFYRFHDQQKTLAHLAKAVDLEPKEPKWNFEMGQSLMWGMNGKVEPAKAFEQYELCLKKAAELPGGRLDPQWVREAAKAALAAGELKKARQYSQDLLDGKNLTQDNSREDSEYDANTVLGMLALRQKDLRSAKAYLKKLGANPASPTMRSVGPDLELADALLKAGESKSVLEYLNPISGYWKPEKVKAWVKKIEAGEKPNLDRFASEDKLIKAGAKAPLFTLKDVAGKAVSLEEELKKGPVILDFWATWCGPCRRSAPLLEEAVQKANDGVAQPVQVLAIDLKEKAGIVSKFLGQKAKAPGYHWLLDLSGTVSDQYGADSLPSFVYIGMDGVVRESYVSWRDPSDFKRSALKLAGKAFPGPPSPPLTPPFVVADFNGNSKDAFGPGKLIVEDTCEPKTLSELEFGPAAEGADKTTFLRWKLKMLGEPEGCQAKPWAWIRVPVPDKASNLTRCAGVRLWFRSSQPDIICYFKFRYTDDRCGDNVFEKEVKLTAPTAWTQLQWPLSDFIPRKDWNCTLTFDRVNQIQLVTGGAPAEAVLDLDQLEFY